MLDSEKFQVMSSPTKSLNIIMSRTTVVIQALQILDQHGHKADRDSYQTPRPKTAMILNFCPADKGRLHTAGSGTTRTYMSVSILRPAYIYVTVPRSE
jgi:hypothetical protein